MLEGGTQLDLTMEEEEVPDTPPVQKDLMEEGMLIKGSMKTRSFQILFGQLGLEVDTLREAAQALVKVIIRGGKNMYTTNALLTKLARSNATVVVFREPSSMGYNFYHNRPLYMEASVEGRRVRRALVDGGSGVNIIPTAMFHAMGLPFDQLRPTTIKLNTFHREAMAPRRFIVVMLEVRPIKTPNKFQVVDEEPSYHILLGCPWLHLHQCVTSTWH